VDHVAPATQQNPILLQLQASRLGQTAQDILSPPTQPNFITHLTVQIVPEFLNLTVQGMVSKVDLEAEANISFMPE